MNSAFVNIWVLGTSELHISLVRGDGQCQMFPINNTHALDQMVPSRIQDADLNVCMAKLKIDQDCPYAPS